MHSLLILAIFVFKYCFPKHKFVYAECAMGEFGENCAGRCYCALGATCNVTSGICPDECEVGFEGEFCHIGKFLLYVAHSIRNIITLCKNYLEYMILLTNKIFNYYVNDISKEDTANRGSWKAALQLMFCNSTNTS